MSTLAAQRGSAPLRGLTSSLSSLSLQTPSGRAFSTTPAALTKTIALHRIPAFPIPDYPLGPRLIYKQSNGGLYATARIRRGNNISSDHKVKTPRAWRPNIHRKRLWSAALGVWVRARLSLRVLRTIRKEGGLDAYVLKRPPCGRASPTSAPASASCGPAGVEDENNTDLVHVLVDGATPGPLSAVSRASSRAAPRPSPPTGWPGTWPRCRPRARSLPSARRPSWRVTRTSGGAGEQVGGTVEELDAAIEAMEKDEAKRS
ncbi:54S ribosomal protein L24 [Verticillium alfalfae VaMs.102]|uniref:54S ribosomal protein L24 n=1 Tax=Verticillium alfalfae (strain VaMs.102 / ATCC MYA-4576 / FGSC 10136) TaxID=526221 RepID=C9SFC9_VERA1|nr:54S ribosomal protein L24 [Verticillium alfalfae VaMs.102]EEY17915.1 54S ribosomal protein L24 [Verticillium alfalfae VaMs.102]